MTIASDLLTIYNNYLNNSISNINFYLNHNGKLSIIEYLRNVARQLSRMAFIHIELGSKPQIRESSYIALTGFKPAALSQALLEAEIRNNVLWLWLGTDNLPVNEFHNIINGLSTYLSSEGLTIQYNSGVTSVDITVSW